MKKSSFKFGIIKHFLIRYKRRHPLFYLTYFVYTVDCVQIFKKTNLLILRCFSGITVDYPLFFLKVLTNVVESWLDSTIIKSVLCILEIHLQYIIVHRISIYSWFSSSFNHQYPRIHCFCTFLNRSFVESFTNCM